MIQKKHNILLTIGVLIVIAILLWGMPSYNVWQKELAGKAEFKQAEWNRQILIKEAEANLEAEKLNAMAEVERAKGVAEANKIIGSSLEENEAYLRYLWIQGLQDGTSEVIYVPTEANLPLLEAGRFN
jgi:hypothetical protein